MLSFILRYLLKYRIRTNIFKEKTMGKYIEIADKAQFDNLVAQGVTFVDFWAPWCGPCRMLAPIIDELAVEYEGKAKICKVNTDDVQDLAVEFGVRSIPTMLFFKDGQVKETLIGAQSKVAISDKINSLL